MVEAASEAVGVVVVYCCCLQKISTSFACCLLFALLLISGTMAQDAKILELAFGSNSKNFYASFSMVLYRK